MPRPLSLLAGIAGAVRYEGRSANGRRANRNLQKGHHSLSMLLRRIQPRRQKVLDRAISLSLPFFTYRSGRVHHPLRYQNRPTLTVCFYGAVTDFERETAMRLVEANRVNMGFSSVQVYFAEKPELMAEVIKSR